MHSLTIPLDYLTDVLAVLFDPGLRTHLYRVPGTTQGRCVAQVKGIEVIDEHAMKQGRGKDVDPLGHFPMPVADYLCPQQATRLAISWPSSWARMIHISSRLSCCSRPEPSR